MAEGRALPDNSDDGQSVTAENAADLAAELFAVDASEEPVGALGASPRVLLIEDDFILRAHLAELLMLEGYVVTCAADGAEALRRLQEEPHPSVILVDIVLPRVDGIAFRQIQLRTPVLRDIPTIAITSRGDVADRQELAFATVMKKPLNLDRVIQLLAKLCHQT